MSEMVERVAAAIWEEFASQNWHKAWFKTAFPSGKPLGAGARIARAAIAAMREKTPAMRALDESLALFWDNTTAPPTLQTKLGAHTGASWEQMIDEALK